MVKCIQQPKDCGKTLAFIQMETLKFLSATGNFINKAMKMEVLTKKGFTLVELLAVISIIALLSTIAIVSLGSARTKARDGKRIADMRQVSTALEQYYADNGGYPAYLSTAQYVVLGDTNHKALCSRNDTGGSSLNTSANCPGATYTVYMGNIPGYPNPPTLGTCTNTTPTANYCYTSDTVWASVASHAGSYSLFWLLEASNTSLGGKNCTTTPNGVTCT